jgi:hypothetical protein
VNAYSAFTDQPHNLKWQIWVKNSKRSKIAPVSSSSPAKIPPCQSSWVIKISASIRALRQATDTPCPLIGSLYPAASPIKQPHQPMDYQSTHPDWGWADRDRRVSRKNTTQCALSVIVRNHDRPAASALYGLSLGKTGSLARFIGHAS